MADPFSIITGTIGAVDVCYRFGRYLHELQAEAAHFEDEIAKLIRVIDALDSINRSLRTRYEDFTESYSAENPAPKEVAKLWRDINSNLEDCCIIVKDLEDLVKAVVGKQIQDGGPKWKRKLGDFRKQLRKQSKESQFERLSERIHTYHTALQLMLDLVILNETRRNHSVATESFAEFEAITGKSLQEIKSDLDFLLSTIASNDAKSLHDSLGSAQNVLSNVSANEHFYVPHGAISLYTGRSTALDAVRDAFEATTTAIADARLQKRIVIYGLGGSGKTQFCCEYAQRHRYSYWGIFWINASSHKDLKQTYQDIAKIGGVGDSVNAAKHWLANLKAHWLLIVDNADDDKIPLSDYFPEGERGHILVTTRIPSNRIYGTVGQQYLHFEGLEEDDATTLLLKVASKPIPGDPGSQKHASKIVEELGALPLALWHAGKAILKGLCSLANYLIHYKREMETIRQARDLQGFREGDNIHMNVHSTFEINFQGLQRKKSIEAHDAIQLLQTFSFFHRENIRMEFLMKAITNPQIEKRNEEDQQKEIAIATTGKPRTWHNILKGLAWKTIVFIYEEKAPPVLPSVLRGTGEGGDDRLRAALSELTELSLINHDELSNSWSMHPVVHTWARVRPECSAMEQAVWCQAAITAMSQCILIPPLGNCEDDERLRHELLPHVDHVRERYEEIGQRISAKKGFRMSSLFRYKATMTGTQAKQMSKFALVYAQAYRWEEAEQLLLSAKDFCSKMLDETDPRTRRLKLALSKVKSHLCLFDEAAQLLKEVLQTCRTCLGRHHPDTLRVTDMLGESRWQQGRFTQSKILHERAMNGLENSLGRDHEDTLKVMDNLGRAYASLWRIEEARDLHRKAVQGMRRNSKLGPTHLDTLIAMNNLAATFLDYGGDANCSVADLEDARRILLEVVKAREIKLGKEHPWTLWTILCLARVKCAQGHFAEAEADIRAGLVKGERNLGYTHLGVLCGKLYLSETLIRQEYYNEAEETLLGLAEGYQTIRTNNKGEHPDRVRSLDLLSTCCQLQGRMDEAIDFCNQAVTGLEALHGHAHPYMTRLKEKVEGLKQAQIASQASPLLHSMSHSKTELPNSSI